MASAGGRLDAWSRMRSKHQICATPICPRVAPDYSTAVVHETSNLRRALDRASKRRAGNTLSGEKKIRAYMDAGLSIDRFELRGDGSFGAWLARLATCNLQGCHQGA